MKQILLHSIDLFKKATFWKKLIFRKAIFRIAYFFWRTVFLERQLFQKTLPSVAATFSEELLFYNVLFQKSYYFTTMVPFHSYTSYLFVNNEVISVPVRCSLNAGFLSCVSVIAQNCIIDGSTNVFARATFPEDTFFWNSWFSTANLVFTVTLFIYRLVINHTNTGVFRLKLPEGPRNNFLLIPWTKILLQICLGSIEQDYLSKNIKNLSFWGV